MSVCFYACVSVSMRLCVCGVESVTDCMKVSTWHAKSKICTHTMHAHYGICSSTPPPPPSTRLHPLPHHPPTPLGLRPHKKPVAGSRTAATLPRLKSQMAARWGMHQHQGQDKPMKSMKQTSHMCMYVCMYVCGTLWTGNRSCSREPYGGQCPNQFGFRCPRFLG